MSDELPYREWSRSKWGAHAPRVLDSHYSSLLAGAVGLAAESGELLDVMKKVVFHQHSLGDSKEKLLKELGDVRYYFEQLLIDLDVTMAEVESMNREKLNARYKAGFTSEESINRKG